MRKQLFLLLMLGILFTGWQVSAQERTVSGKVTASEDGSPLPGVSVTVKGTKSGTQTDGSGVYKINVSGYGFARKQYDILLCTSLYQLSYRLYYKQVRKTDFYHYVEMQKQH